MRITKCTYYAFRDQLKHEFENLKVLYWDRKLIEEFGVNILEEAD